MDIEIYPTTQMEGKDKEEAEKSREESLLEDGAAVLGPPKWRGCPSNKVVQTPDITEQERHKS